MDDAARDDIVFPAVEERSALYAPLCDLRAAISADPRLLPRPGDAVRAELLPRRTDSGDVELRRFYWSVRRDDAAAPYGFTARTLYDGRRSAAPVTVDFPDEPVMDWLAGTLAQARRAGSARVLRYIPLRRVTFLLEGAPGLPPRVIAKTKRTAGLRRAVAALTVAREASARAGTGEFTIPRPLGVDEDLRLLYLEELPGRPLADVLGELDPDAALRRLGAVHRAVHELPVLGLGTRTTSDWLAAAEVAAYQVGALLPSLEGAVEALTARLRLSAPAGGEPAFCQGDFVPSQILCADEGWSVLDLDDGHLADPVAEVAALYTALPRELSVSAPQEAARLRAAYLQGYVERAGEPLDGARWRWHRTVAELRYIARRLVKGRARPGEAETVLGNAVDVDESLGAWVAA